MKFILAATILAASLVAAPAFASEKADDARLSAVQANQNRALVGFEAVELRKAAYGHNNAVPAYDPSREAYPGK